MAICQQSRPGQILGARSHIIRPSNVGINCLRSRLRIKKTRACPEHQDSRPSVFQISSQGMGLKWAQENVYEILAEAAIIRKTTRLQSLARILTIMTKPSQTKQRASALAKYSKVTLRLQSASSKSPKKWAANRGPNSTRHRKQSPYIDYRNAARATINI